jgi:hypothetical protein
MASLTFRRLNFKIIVHRDCRQWQHNVGSSPHSVKTLKASAVEVGAPVYAALRTRILSRSKLARPYMERLINLRRCTFPSTGPLLQP